MHMYYFIVSIDNENVSIYWYPLKLVMIETVVKYIDATISIKQTSWDTIVQSMNECHDNELI